MTVIVKRTLRGTLFAVTVSLVIGGCAGGDSQKTDRVRIQAAVGSPALDVILLGAYTAPSEQLLQPSLEETSAEVTVGLQVPESASPIGPAAQFRCIEVRLRRPIGARTLIDVATDRPFTVSARSADPFVRKALMECAGTTR